MDLLFCGSGWLPVVDAIASRLDAGDRVRVWDRGRPLAVEVAATRPDVLLPSNGRVDAAVIAAATGLALIQQPAVGTDAIDLAAAAARGIPVCNAPGANQVAVAEATLLLLLALARRWHPTQAAFRGAVVGAPAGVELAGRRLTVVGHGRTGAAVATRARALGLEVQVATSATSRAELLALLAASDAVTLHCPLTAATRGLIDAEALAALPPHALLVNLARGPVVERAALEAALARGHLGGVGLDVFWDEPWDPDEQLYADPRVVTLPHVAGSTTEAFARIAAVVVDNVARMKRGAPLVHRIC
ncbi:MAG: NAD(P)-dependent oxidoreductase [Kofleriaceae bacterium]